MDFEAKGQMPERFWLVVDEERRLVWKGDRFVKFAEMAGRSPAAFMFTDKATAEAVKNSLGGGVKVREYSYSFCKDVASGKIISVAMGKN